MSKIEWPRYLEFKKAMTENPAAPNRVIAEIMGVSETTIRYWRKKTGIKKQRKVSTIRNGKPITINTARIGLSSQTLEVAGSRVTDQIGGDHYARLKLQPFDLIKAMEPSGNAFVDYARGCIIKYACRKKGDLAKMAEDLEKAAHYAKAAADHIRQLNQQTQ